MDSTRVALPRLFFLSNDEVLALTSTNQLSLFLNTLTQLFMHERGKLVIFGMNGDDGFQFTLS
jgi:hypothetical protein